VINQLNLAAKATDALSASRLFLNLDLKKQIDEANKLRVDAVKLAASDFVTHVSTTEAAATALAAKAKEAYEKALEKVRSPI